MLHGFKRANREFNQKSFDINDEKGRKSVVQFLKTKGIEARDNPNIVGVDLIINGVSPASGKVFKEFPVEVERRQIWDSKIWPYETYFIPERKKKFFYSECLYAVVNNGCTKVMFINSKDIVRCKIKEISTKHQPEGEFFYVIPLQKFSKVYEINWD